MLQFVNPNHVASKFMSYLLRLRTVSFTVILKKPRKKIRNTASDMAMLILWNVHVGLLMAYNISMSVDRYRHCNDILCNLHKIVYFSVKGYSPGDIRDMPRSLIFHFFELYCLICFPFV